MMGAPGIQPTTRPESTEPPYPSARYAWYVVGVLTLVYVFSFIDRQILNLLVRPIRRDLGISDTQMSLLMGFSFAIFYTVFGMPLGRLADAKNRRGIIAIGFAVWSAFTAACGLAQNFTHMLLARIGVGVGEASLSPAAYSLISDYFPPHRRSTALGVYGMGIYLGGGLALLLGGILIKFTQSQDLYTFPLVGQIRGWQLVFFAVGLPGVFLSLIMFTVREPFRRGMMKSTNQPVPFREVVAYIGENWRTFVCHGLGFGLVSMGSYGASSWVPTYLVRHFGFKESDAGISYGLIVATAGTLGIFFGGWMADWMRGRGRLDSNMRVALYVTMASLPIAIVAYRVESAAWFLALIWPVAFLTAAPFGVAPAAIQQMMPNPMRAQASSIYLFLNNLIGLGLGPTAVALFTDYVFHSDAAVGESLLSVTVIGKVLSAIFLWYGLRPFLHSLDRLKTWTAANN
jgi:MFS family permease